MKYWHLSNGEHFFHILRIEDSLGGDRGGGCEVVFFFWGGEIEFLYFGGLITFGKPIGCLRLNTDSTKVVTVLLCMAYSILYLQMTLTTKA